MIIKSLEVISGFENKVFSFGQKTLIYSEESGVGKTSLLRILLLALGYPIPSTRGFNFQSYNYILSISTDSKQELTLKREGSSMTIENNGERSFYTLPYELNQVLEIVFEIKNSDVLQSLLGCYYIDQEKGWTLLNRGKVIGKIQFSIERLVLGLGDKDVSVLRQKLSDLTNEEKKYNLLKNTEEYKQEVFREFGPITPTLDVGYDETKLQTLKFELISLNNQISNIDSVLKQNRSFKKYIEKMKIRVKNAEGVIIPVNEETIYGLDDSLNYLNEKKRLLAHQKQKTQKEISRLSLALEDRPLFPKDLAVSDRFAYDIANIEIDQKVINRSLSRIHREKNQIEENIKHLTKSNHEIVSFLHSTISGYANELGLDQKFVPPEKDYIFTNDLKSLTGVNYYKLVFIFHLAYISAIYKFQNIRVPIIIDSPKGKEITDIEVNKMLDLLVRDYSDHQIIIASIFRYNINFPEIIIKNRLLPF